MNQPLVSIIMPVFGVEKYIAKAIESVQSQSYSNWELVIVNDGTRDNSRHIAECYAESDSRITIVDKENGGLSDARNFGLQYIHGNYLHFFDSDDFIDADFYDKVVNFMESYNFDFVITGYTTDYYDENNNMFGQKKSAPETGAYSAKFIKDNIARYQKFLDFAWNKFYLASFILDNNLMFKKGLSLIEDAEFMNHVFEDSLNFSFMNFAGYHYCQHNRKSLSNTFSPNTIALCAERIDIVKEKLHILGMGDDTIKATLPETAFYQYKFIFYMLFNSSESDKTNIIRKALDNRQLHDCAIRYKTSSLFDTLVLFSIKYRTPWIVNLIYRLKLFIKRVF